MSTPDHKRPAPALTSALTTAVTAARAAGGLMRANWHKEKRIAAETQHDIKLELDVRCQKTIERILRRAAPEYAVMGEEGVSGDPAAACRWVIDPIDGTVNFTYGIPHACVSIALQERTAAAATREPDPGDARPAKPDAEHGYRTAVGVVYDPFTDELWTAIRGRPARLNGKIARVSSKSRLGQTIVSVGFAKEKHTLERMLPALNQLVHRVRKIRIMGSAALSLTYVASGRMDAYIEYGLRLWDIAAGGLIVECAGGEFWREPVLDGTRYRVLASNGKLRQQLARHA